MTDKIIPVPRSLFLCDFHVGYPDGRVDLSGVFNAIRPAVYPHVRPRLVLFAQLSGGLGDVPFFFDIRREGADEGIWTTEVRTVRFPDRTAIRQLVMTITGIRFPGPGVNVVDLFCHNTWVCDATVSLE